MANTFERIRFVLVETSHPGNVGSTARAMKTMGFSDLVLVNPRDPEVTRHDEAIALSSGAADILATVRIVPTLMLLHIVPYVLLGGVCYQEYVFVWYCVVFSICCMMCSVIALVS